MKTTYIYHLLVLALTSLLLSSCYSHRVIGLLQEPTKHNGIPRYEQEDYEEYRIRVNDEIIYRLISLDETLYKTLHLGENYSDQYANSYRVYADSTIDIPFLPPIKIGGLTISEAQEALKEAFREMIPDADIKLALYNKTFSVIGDARSGTYYIYKDKLNIFQALAMTGDVMNSGDRRHIRIIRPKGNGDKPEILEFDIRTNSIIDSKYYYIYPNDVIYVARTKQSFFAVNNLFAFIGLITSSVSLLISLLNYSATLTGTTILK